MQHRVLSLIIYKFTYLHLLKTVIKTSLTKGLARQCNLSKTNHLHVLSAQNLIVLVTSPDVTLFFRHQHVKLL